VRAARPSLRRRLPLAALCIPPLLVACGGGGGGTAGGLVLEEVRWGRLVEVRDLAWKVVASDFLVGEWNQGDGFQYEFRTNLATRGQILRILSPLGTPSFDAALAWLEGSLGGIAPSTGLPSFPLAMVPRNAALLLRFNQPVRTESLSPQSIRILEPASTPEPLGVRMFVDPRDPRRVIVDPVLSAEEGASLGVPANDLGFPGASTTIAPNLELRIPTRGDPSIGQTALLRGASGGTLEDDDPSDGPDLVRSFRSGGRTSVTGDPNEGFLFDPWPPAIVGERPVSICSVEPVAEGRQAVSLNPAGSGPLAPGAGDALRQGNAIGLVVGILPQIGGCPSSGVGARLLVEPLSPVSFGIGAGAFVTALDVGDPVPPQWFVAFDPLAAAPPNTGVDPLSVVRIRFTEPIDPTTLVPNDNFGVTKVNPSQGGFDALVPLDFAVGDVSRSGNGVEIAFIPVVPLSHVEGAAEEMFFWIRTGMTGPRDLAGNPLAGPTVTIPFSLAPGAASTETAGFALRFGSINETDFGLAGPDPEGKPEIAGQLVLGSGEIRGRPVERFSKVVDPWNPFVGAGPTFGLPVLTPLTSYGSRLQTVWRHCDLGLSSVDTTEMNLDLEGLAWAPAQTSQGGTASPGSPGDIVVPGVPSVIADTLPRLRIRLSHSYYFPDEALDFGSLFPAYPTSGLNATEFYPTTPPSAGNPLGEKGNPFGFWHWDPEMSGGAGGVRSDPPVDVHDGPYAIDPLSATVVAGSGTTIVPFPPFGQTYTWRDTGFPFALKGGPNGVGVEPMLWETVFAEPRPAVYPAGQIPSVALPLLLEFRSYPGTGLNLNGLQVSLPSFIGTGYGGQGLLPNFRVFTTGGFNTAGLPVSRNPDGNLPLGGLNPLSTPPGLPTSPAGKQIYWGRADFVVRVSRAFTHWFDLGPMETPGAPLFAPPVVGPAAQEEGTSAVVEFRGASAVAGSCASVPPTCDELRDASKANVYGVFLANPSFQVPTGLLTGVAPPFTPNNPALSEWTSDLTRLNGKRYLQMRFTFTSDAQTGAVGRLSAVGVGFSR
jgi:hypothetical protein